jgi:hypothetical protein
MQVRLRHLPTLRRDEYRMTFDLIDSGRGPWDQGDCVGQIDLLDAPGQHASSARGLFKPALELYRLAPGASRRRPRTPGSCGTSARPSIAMSTASSRAACSAPADPAQRTTPGPRGDPHAEGTRVPG